MSTLTSLILFSAIVSLVVLLFKPVITRYVDAYAVRVRAQKSIRKMAAAEPRQSMLLALCKRIGNLVLNFSPYLVDNRTATLLIQANYRTPDHLAIFIGIKSIIVITIVSLGVLESGGNPAMVLLLFLLVPLAWYMPNFFLAIRVSKRKEKIIHELPTVIDLLIVCAQAGISLVVAIDKVSLEVADTCPVLCSEFQQLINEIKIFGKTLIPALTELSERCGVEELSNLTSALISAETKGTNISYALQAQAEAMRDKIKRKKEEEANKLPIKMVPVTAFFIMPLLMDPLLGPAMLNILQSMEVIFNTGNAPHR